MARRSDWYDPSGLWKRDSPGLERWRPDLASRFGGDSLVRLKAAYIRVQEAPRYIWNAKAREYLPVKGSRVDRRELVGYWSPLTGELWSEEDLRQVWSQLIIACGYTEPLRATPWLTPLNETEAEQPPAFWASRCLWKREGARMSREQ